MSYVECYEFRLGSMITLRYTSDEVAFVGEGKAYQPLPGLARSAFGVVTTNESREFTITLPAYSQVSKEVAMFKTPPKTTVIFRRYERTAPNVTTMYFEAVLIGASISGEVCTLKFPDSFQNAAEGSVPRNITQPGCNWSLADKNCQVAASTKGISFDRSKISYRGMNENGEHIYQIASMLLPNPIGWFRRGTLTQNTTKGSEVRTIFGLSPFNAWSSTDSACYITVMEPFVDVAGNITFQLLPGCTKLRSIAVNPDYHASCESYANQARFGGFPWMPTEKANPFTKPIKL